MNWRPSRRSMSNNSKNPLPLQTMKSGCSRAPSTASGKNSKKAESARMTVFREPFLKPRTKTNNFGIPSMLCVLNWMPSRPNMKNNSRKRPQPGTMKSASSKAPSMACGKNWRRPESGRMNVFNGPFLTQMTSTDNSAKPSTPYGMSWIPPKLNTKNSYKKRPQQPTTKTVPSKTRSTDSAKNSKKAG